MFALKQGLTPSGRATIHLLIILDQRACALTEGGFGLFEDALPFLDEAGGNFEDEEALGLGGDGEETGDGGVEVGDDAGDVVLGDVVGNFARIALNFGGDVGELEAFAEGGFEDEGLLVVEGSKVRKANDPQENGIAVVAVGVGEGDRLPGLPIEVADAGFGAIEHPTGGIDVGIQIRLGGGAEPEADATEEERDR